MIWLGDDFSHSEYGRYEARLETLTGADLARLQEEDEEGNPVPVQVLDSGLAIMDVSGTTVTKSNWLTRLFGLVSYDDIRERVAQLADDESVKTILMSINSGGGAAEGVARTSKFIRQVSDNVKPVFAHTSGRMASAAMWYGSAGDAVYADEDARLGSVGAIAIHREYVDQLKARGISATVFRSAPFKALGQQEERLSDVARKQIQTDLDAMHERFVNGLAHNLGLNPGDVQANIANGKMFSAQEALSHRLASRIISFDELVAKLNTGLRQ